MSGLLRIVDLGVGATITRARRTTSASTTTARSSSETGTHADPPVGGLAEPAARPGDRARRPREPRRAVPRGARRADRCCQRGRRCASSCMPLPLPARGRTAPRRSAPRAGRTRRSHSPTRTGSRRAAWARYVASGPRPGARTRRRGARSSSRVPAEGCGPGTPWARMFAFLHERYQRPHAAAAAASTRSSSSTSPTSSCGRSARRRPPPTRSRSARRRAAHGRADDGLRAGGVRRRGAPG